MSSINSRTRVDHTCVALLVVKLECADVDETFFFFNLMLNCERIQMRRLMEVVSKYSEDTFCNSRFMQCRNKCAKTKLSQT